MPQKGIRALTHSDVRWLRSDLSGRRLTLLPVLAGFLLLAGVTGHASPRSARAGSASSTPAALTALAMRLQSSYRHAQWNAVATVFVHRQQSQSLVDRMRTWRLEHVRDVQVSLAYLHRLSSDDYAATFEFAGDRGAIPDFDTYLIRLRGGSAVIDGAPQLLPGAPNHPHWLVIRTAHFTIFHGPYQLEGTDRHFVADLEYQRSQVGKEFGVQLPPRVQLYLFPDQRTMRDVTHGKCGATPGEIGCTSPFSRPPTISAVIRAIFHEPIHAYQLALLPPPPGPGTVYVAPLFIAEGMAVALQDRAADPALSDYCSDLDFQPLDHCARFAVRHVRPMDLLTDKGFKHTDPGYAYALAGSFVTFLIHRSGDTRFGRYYFTLAAQPKDRLSDYDVAARKIYHTSTRSLIQDWTSALVHGNR